jgi:hypothetical protein
MLQAEKVKLSLLRVELQSVICVGGQKKNVFHIIAGMLSSGQPRAILGPTIITLYPLEITT